jgi:carnitine-CoA ligase
MARFMVPRYVELLDELPRNPLGKVLKRELREVGPATWDAEATHKTTALKESLETP